MTTQKPSKKTRKKPTHSNSFVSQINDSIFRRNFIIFSILALFGAVYTAFGINNTSTIATSLPDTYTISGSSIDLDLSSVIELPSSGWDDSSDRISIEVSITNGSADDAIVDRSTDGCIIDISSSSSSNTFATIQGNGAVNYDGDNTENVFTFNDRTAQLTLMGLASEVKEAIGRVRASCNTQALFAGKYIRVGAVPTISSGSGAAACGDDAVDCENLYYLFSTQHYYRVSRMTSGITSGTQGIIDVWNKAKSITIDVDGTNKTGGNRRGFVGTLSTRDELLLTDAIRGTGPTMIGTTDLSGSFAYDTSWGGSGTNCATDEGTFSWLGPDRWCSLIPTWNKSGDSEWSPNQQTTNTTPNNEESRYWSRDSSGDWSRGTASSFTIDLGSSTIPTTEDQSGTHNGYNFFHGWHTDTSGPDEPNSSGDFIYLGYGGSGGNPGWDDANPGVNGRGESNAADVSNFPRFIQEFCNPNQTCAPDANAVDSAQFKIAQTITFSGASSAYSTETVNLTAATTTSGLTITYTTNDSNICTVSSSAVVTLVSRGTCTVTAAQSGNDDYLAATSVAQSFTSNFGPIFSGVNTSCTGIGQLDNGSFETISLGTAGTIGGGDTSPTGTWHGYGGPSQILFLDIDAGLNQNVNPWNTTATNKVIEIQRAVSGSIDTNGTQNFDSTNVSPQDGIYMAELNATQTSALYQDVSTLPGSILRWEIFHRGRKYTATANDGDQMKVQIGSTTASGYGSASAQSAIDQTPESGFDVNSTGTSGSISGTTIKSERSDGWYRVRGAYRVPSGQTTTRFAFSAISGLHAVTVGNLLDNISFTPNIACPFTKTIIKGRSATLNVFSDDNLTDAEESLGATDSTIGSTISVSSGSGSVTRVNSNRSMQFSSPNSTGTSVVRFRITNTFGDTSDADATFNIVDDLTQTAPTIIPVDPRARFVDLPQIDILGSSVSKALLCYRQSQSNGSELASGHSLVSTVRTNYSNTLTNDGSTSELSINGTIANVESSSSWVRITNSTSGRAVLDSNTSKYLRVRVSGDDDLSTDSCANGSSADQSKVIELKPVQLETTRNLNINVD
jgi:hypothetical protein